MKEETNKELDLLLRRLSRRQDGVVPGNGSSISGEHLDADELNSYAENVLPAAARARYTEHLAECARCRGIIVQLSSSAGVIASVDQTAKVPTPSGLRNFLASLFSPMVLRYAVPAVGLILVAAIAFFVMDDRRGASEVATSAPPQPVATDSSGMIYSVNSNQSGSNTDPSQSPAVAGRKSPDSEPVKAPVPNAPPVVGSFNAQEKDAPRQVEETAAAAEAPPAAKREAKPQPTVNDFSVEIETKETKIEGSATDVAKMRDKKTDDQLQKDKAANQPKAEERTENKAADSVGPASVTAAAPASGAGSSSRRARQGAMTIDGVDSDAEIRVVAGRRFRKERAVWIDTAYSGGATTNLARGSEQYRALIADEPPIKSIADQLGGEIIVVWKGRAYRIR